MQAREPLRAHFIKEAIATIELAREAGLDTLPDLGQDPFDVLSLHPDFGRLSSSGVTEDATLAVF